MCVSREIKAASRYAYRADWPGLVKFSEEIPVHPPSACQTVKVSSSQNPQNSLGAHPATTMTATIATMIQRAQRATSAGAAR